MTAHDRATAADCSWPLLTASDRSWPGRTRPLMTAHDRSCLLLTTSDRSWPLVTAHERWLLTAHPFMLRNAHTHTRTHTQYMHARTDAHTHNPHARTSPHRRTHTHKHKCTFVCLFMCVCACVFVCVCGCSGIEISLRLPTKLNTIKTLKPTWIKHHWNLETNTNTTKIT